MNNKLILGILFLLMLVHNSSAEHHSNSNNFRILEKNNSDFFDTHSSINPSLLSALKKYKEAVLTKDVDYLYSIRTESFKKVVSREIFETVLFKNVIMPTEIYFSENQSLVNKNDAKIKAYYLHHEGKFDYMINSNDQWKFDNKNNQWIFVSNYLSWGTSIIKE